MNDNFYDFDAARNGMVAAALLDFGTPYRWGGNSPVSRGLDATNTPWETAQTRGLPGGIDCSGAVLRWIRGSGLSVKDYTSSQMFRKLSGTDTPWRGDLCFYGKHIGAVTHVAMCLVDGGDVVIGANGGGRPKRYESYGDYSKRMDDADARVTIELAGYKFRKDFLGFRKPPFLAEIK